jgi:hypothetical protein
MESLDFASFYKVFRGRSIVALSLPGDLLATYKDLKSAFKKATAAQAEI